MASTQENRVQKGPESVPWKRTLMALASTLLLAGCAQNASMDGELVLPASADGLYVRVSVRRDGRFEDLWDSSSLPSSVRLGTSPQEYNFSLVSESFDQDVLVKVEYCREADCEGLRCTGEECGPLQRADPQAAMWVTLEHPFYQAKVTRWALTIPAVPTCTDASCSDVVALDGSDEVERYFVDRCTFETSEGYPVWRCDVGRCDIQCTSVAGSAVGGSCLGPDGVSGPHFCE